MNNQVLSYAAVNAHHQNGVAECRIRELQNLSQTMMIHGAKTNLWPYALQQTNEIIHNSPNMLDKQGRSPIEIFTGTKVAINVKHYQTVGNINSNVIFIT